MSETVSGPRGRSRRENSAVQREVARGGTGPRQRSLPSGCSTRASSSVVSARASSASTTSPSGRYRQRSDRSSSTTPNATSGSRGLQPAHWGWRRPATSPRITACPVARSKTRSQSQVCGAVRVEGWDQPAFASEGALSALEGRLRGQRDPGLAVRLAHVVPGQDRAAVRVPPPARGLRAAGPAPPRVFLDARPRRPPPRRPRRPGPGRQDARRQACLARDHRRPRTRRRRAQRRRRVGRLRRHRVAAGHAVRASRASRRPVCRERLIGHGEPGGPLRVGRRRRDDHAQPSRAPQRLDRADEPRVPARARPRDRRPRGPGHRRHRGRTGLLRWSGLGGARRACRARRVRRRPPR